MKIVAGKLLVSEPFMLDPNFKRSVILICDHHEEDGTIGFVLNKTINMKINDLLATFPTFDANVYYGGPVQTDTIHYIHTLGDLLPNSVEIMEGVWFGGDFDELKNLANLELLEAKDIRFFVGYTGWSAGQLHNEIITKSWFLAEGDFNYVFNHKYLKTMWTDVLQHEGGTKSVIGQIPRLVSLS
ncbi:MAG: YqgE/AlgH family protein [Saprospiraceae bacterium]|nr:YqgE/AlgH family protein [Saprospiraceae bacterium]